VSPGVGEPTPLRARSSQASKYQGRPRPAAACPPHRAPLTRCVRYRPPRKLASKPRLLVRSSSRCHRQGGRGPVRVTWLAMKPRNPTVQSSCHLRCDGFLMPDGCVFQTATVSVALKADKGTTTWTIVPSPGFDTILSVPPTASSRSPILISPRPFPHA